MSKSILILGAGNAQIDLIKYCKSIGLETHGCSYTDTDSGIRFLDYFSQIDIVDTDAVRAYMDKHKIDYIYSVGSDIAVPTFCEVAEELGKFSFISSETAQICCNKHLMRQKMIGSRFNLSYAVCSSLEEAIEVNCYPVMMKPVDSQGQRGVFLIHDRGELETFFERSICYSKSKGVILEQYVSGDEVSVNAYIKDGQVIFRIVSDRISFDELPGGIIKSHRLPSIYENTQTIVQINQLVSEAVEKLKIHNGPAYFQIKISDGHPYLIEATPRLDGCHMWNLIRRYCGVNLLELTMKHFLGEEIQIRAYTPAIYPMYLEFFCEPPGTVFDEDKYSDYHSDYRVMYYQTGDKIKKMNGYMEKCGYRIYQSPRNIGVIGGSGSVGTCFSRMYEETYNIVDISRKSGLVTQYSYEELVDALVGCDSAVILAAKKVDSREEQTFELYHDNIRVVENTLKACRKLGIKNIVFTSSRCVYGKEQPTPVSENGIIQPIDYYGISKYTAEQICMYESHRFGLSIKILRLAQIISREDNGYMIGQFVKNALAGVPLTVYGNGAGKRDYIYIKDVCRAIMQSLLHFHRGGVYNIGSGRGTTAIELAQAAIRALNPAGQWIMLPDKPEDSAVFYLDVSKAKNHLGFDCAFSLVDAFYDLKER